LNISSK